MTGRLSRPARSIWVQVTVRSDMVAVRVANVEGCWYTGPIRALVQCKLTFGQNTNGSGSDADGSCCSGLGGARAG